MKTRITSQNASTSLRGWEVALGVEEERPESSNLVECVEFPSGAKSFYIFDLPCGSARFLSVAGILRGWVGSFGLLFPDPDEALARIRIEAAALGGILHGAKAVFFSVTPDVGTVTIASAGFDGLIAIDTEKNVELLSLDASDDLSSGPKSLVRKQLISLEVGHSLLFTSVKSMEGSRDQLKLEWERIIKKAKGSSALSCLMTTAEVMQGEEGRMHVPPLVWLKRVSTE